MTRLHFIRHGRASARAADYDKLNDQGEQQARLLGAHLAHKGPRFDAVYVGPLRRQLETLRLMREAAGASGAAWPAATVLDGLAEGPFELLMRNHVRPRLTHDAKVKAFARGITAPETPDERELALSGLHAHMTALWLSGEVAAAELETAQAFEARVIAAFETMRAREGLGREVAVVSSSGVISFLLQRAGLVFGPSDGRSALYNTSVSVLELAASGVSVRGHNRIEHLSDPQHVTVL